MGVGIRIPIDGDPAGIERATAKADAAIQRTATKSQRAAKAINAGAKIAALGFVAVGAGALKLAQGAAEDEKAAAALATTLRNTAGATDALVASNEEWITAQGKALGVADDQLRPALAELATATGSVEEAQKLTSLAMDISAGSGKSLQSVSATLAKAQLGNVNALKKLGVQTKDAKGETRSLSDIQDELSKKYKGQASNAANTMAGKMERVKLSLAEAGETIGYALIPALSALGGWLTGTVTPALEDTFGWMQRHQTTVKVIAIGIGALGAAFIVASVGMKIYAVTTKVITAVTKAWAAVQWLINAALLANPIVLVVVGLVALAAGLVIAYKKSETFRKIVNGAFRLVKTYVTTYITIVKNVVKGAFDFIVYFAKNWSLPALILKVVSKVRDHFDGLVRAVRSIPRKIKNAAAGMFDGIKDAFRSAINFIIDKWNSLSFSLPSIDTKIPKVGKIGGFTLSTPNIPRLAAGGIVRARAGGILANIGEGKYDEAVVPLDGKTLGGNTYQITVKVSPTASPIDVGRELVAAISAFERDGGRKRA